MIKRIYLEELNTLLKHFPVVAVIGARQVGKTFLVTKLLEQERDYYNLDDLATLSLAEQNPELILDKTTLITIDEVQRLPSLLLEIKKRVDAEKIPGKFLLTGSANIELIPKLQETLAGRIAFLEVFPITFFEKLNTKSEPGIIKLLQGSSLNSLPKNNFKLNLIDELLCGSFPELVEKQDLFFSQNWYEGYIKSYLERDVRGLANIHSLIDYQRVLALTSTRIANLYSLTELSKDSGISLTTLKRYLNLLIISYQFYELPPFFRNINKRLVKTPKIFSFDSGLSAYLQGLKSILDVERLSRLGSLVENRFVTEIKIILNVFLNTAQISFYRSHGGGEIDLIIEYQNQILPIEIKATSNLKNINPKTLENFLLQFDKEAVLGIIIYLGDKILEIKPQIYLVPWKYLLV